MIFESAKRVADLAHYMKPNTRLLAPKHDYDGYMKFWAPRAKSDLQRYVLLSGDLQ